MTNKDLFHNAVEGRMEELKQKPIVEENKIFFFMLGFVIIISLIFTLIGMLR